MFRRFSAMDKIKKGAKRKKPTREYNVPVSNVFDIFTADDDEEEEENTIINRNHTMNSMDKIPPIVLYDTSPDSKIIIKDLMSKLKGNIQVKYRNNRLIIYSQTSEDFNSIKQELSNKNKEFHTYTEKSKITPRMVIKGLPNFMTEEEIKCDLIKQKINVIKVQQMIKKTGDGPQKLPLFIVTLGDLNEMIKIKKVRQVNSVIIKWEKLKKKDDEITICYNCLTVGHVATNCNKKTVCLNCLGNHKQADCIKEISDPKCANCKGDHFTNDKKCTYYIRNVDLKLSKLGHAKSSKPGNLFSLKQEEFPKLKKPKLSRPAPWFSGPSTSTDQNPSQSTTGEGQSQSSGFFQLFNEIKMLFSSFNITKLLFAIKNIVDVTKQTSDPMSKLICILEGIFSLFD